MSKCVVCVCRRDRKTVETKKKKLDKRQIRRMCEANAMLMASDAFQGEKRSTFVTSSLLQTVQNTSSETITFVSDVNDDDRQLLCQRTKAKQCRVSKHCAFIIAMCALSSLAPVIKRLSTLFISQDLDRCVSIASVDEKALQINKA